MATLDGPVRKGMIRYSLLIDVSNSQHDAFYREINARIKPGSAYRSINPVGGGPYSYFIAVDVQDSSALSKLVKDIKTIAGVNDIMWYAHRHHCHPIPKRESALEVSVQP